MRVYFDNERDRNREICFYGKEIAYLHIECFMTMRIWFKSKSFWHLPEISKHLSKSALLHYCRQSRLHVDIDSSRKWRVEVISLPALSNDGLGFYRELDFHLRIMIWFIVMPVAASATCLLIYARINVSMSRVCVR